MPVKRTPILYEGRKKNRILPAKTVYIILYKSHAHQKRVTIRLKLVAALTKDFSAGGRREEKKNNAKLHY